MIFSTKVPARLFKSMSHFLPTGIFDGPHCNQKVSDWMYLGLEMLCPLDMLCNYSVSKK